MTEGGRIDLLNMALNSWNFDKLVGIGMFLSTLHARVTGLTVFRQVYG
jgi:hypothetical protein